MCPLKDKLEVLKRLYIDNSETKLAIEFGVAKSTYGLAEEPCKY